MIKMHKIVCICYFFSISNQKRTENGKKYPKSSEIFFPFSIVFWKNWEFQKLLSRFSITISLCNETNKFLKSLVCIRERVQSRASYNGVIAVFKIKKVSKFSDKIWNNAAIVYNIRHIYHLLGSPNLCPMSCEVLKISAITFFYLNSRLVECLDTQFLSYDA
jgi:hypothetical protein